MKNITRFLAAICTLGQLHAQGDLAPPPGAPTPGMKTLSQIEARTPLAAGAISHTLSSPGSYYLTGNLSQNGTASAITITAANVTLDLNGYSIIGSNTGSSVPGITMSIAAIGGTVSNGTVKGWSGPGISTAASCVIESIKSLGNATTGILTGDDCRIKHCSVSANTSYGVFTGNQCLIENSTVSGSNRGIQVATRSSVRNCVVSGSVNSGITAAEGCTVQDTSVSGVTNGNGIATGTGAIIRGCNVSNCIGTTHWGIVVSGSGEVDHCTVSSCTALSGIATGSGSSVSHCVASGNTSAQSESGGISAGPGSSVSDCTASQNTSTFATLSEVTGYGIRIDASGGGSSVNRCAVSANKGAGIVAGPQSLVLNNHCTANGTLGGNGPGIFCNNNGSRVEGNNVAFNTWGIKSTAAGCIILKNTSRGNQWSIVAGCSVAPMITTATSAAISGSTGGTAFGSTDPAANWMY